MSETEYTQEQIDALVAADPWLALEATEKYAKYKSKDPFPQVGEALLNSVDLLRYLLTVGIVEPFHVKNIKGVTYQCTFSGEAHQFNQTNKCMEEINLDDTDELILEKNSITYLRIQEKFHVPEYMILRFNLSVSNAYKGLLLGTGPIVDPGFEGNLFIPLHNLTGNDYVIKKGAPLIRVEFTKLTGHINWKNEEKEKNLFSQLEPITKITPRNASFSKYIESALLDSDNKMFYTKEGVISVCSSIPTVVVSSLEMAKMAKENSEAAKKSAETAVDTVENIRKKIWNISIIGGICLFVSLFAMCYSVWSLIYAANNRYDNMVKDIEKCTYQTDTLKQQVETLQKKLKLKL